MWTNRVVVFLSALAVMWALYNYAAKEPQYFYRFFIFLTIPSIIATLWLPMNWLFRLRYVPFLLVGAFFLLKIVFQPTALGKGFVVMSLGWLAIYLTLSLTVKQERIMKKILFFLVLLGGAEALVGLSQSIGYNSLAKGTFTNRNHFSGFLNMTIPLAIGGLYAVYASLKERLRSENYARAWVILLSCTFMCLGVLLSLSRGGTIVLILTLMLIAALLTLKRQRSGKGTISSTAIWILLFLTLAAGAWVGMEALITRFAIIDEAENQRMVVYRDTLELIKDHALVGIGPGMYQWRFRPYQTADAAGWWKQAHNDYLQSFAEWGVVPALLFWAFVFWRFLTSVRSFLREKDPWRQGIALGCVGAIFSILVHSLVDFNLQIPLNWAVFCIILGLSWSVETSRSFPVGGRSRVVK